MIDPYLNHPHLKTGLTRQQLIEVGKGIRDLEQCPDTDAEIEKTSTLSLAACAIMYPCVVERITGVRI